MSHLSNRPVLHCITNDTLLDLRMQYLAFYKNLNHYFEGLQPKFSQRTCLLAKMYKSPRYKLGGVYYHALLDALSEKIAHSIVLLWVSITTL